MRGVGWNDRRSPRGSTTIDAQDLAKVSDRDVLGHIQAHNAPERSEAKKPEIERNASHQSQHGRNGHLKSSSAHERYYEPASAVRKEEDLSEMSCSRRGEPDAYLKERRPAAGRPLKGCHPSDR
jgi:hypothetical protein